MKERDSLASRVGIFGIIGNIILFIFKIIIGIISNSRSMIADSFNSAGDIFASFMTWLGSRISSVPNDSDHNFGHGKAEYIFSMLIGISMIVVAGKLLFDSVVSLVYGNVVNYSIILIIVCIITIVVKIGLFIYCKIIYDKYNNLLVESNMLDHRNDIIITSFTLVAIILTKYGIYWFDGVVGTMISIWIFFVGIKIFKDSYDVLMDTAIDNKSKHRILGVLKEYEEIKEIGNIYSIPVGYNYIVVITIVVDGRMHTATSHELADEIEERIKNGNERITEVIVHIEPFSKKNQ
jgi:cation diffusion facilitator family transporter